MPPKRYQITSLTRLAGTLAFAFAVSAALCLSALEAQAISSICSSLEAQLASGKQGGSKKYARAAKRQRAELQKVQQRMRGLDCHLPGIFRFGSDGGQCRSLQDTASRMRANLQKLSARAGGNAVSPAQRRSILAKLDANGCRDRNHRKLPPGVTAGLSDRKLPNLKNRIIVRGPNGEIPPSAGILLGSYRTMCVRTCDGYYFPISFSARQSDFNRDRLICESMCPGTEVQLYYHSVPDQESEDMISLAGQAYTDHPNALRYRSTSAVREPACSCRATKPGYTIVAGQTPADLEKQEEENAEKLPSIPQPRPNPLSDPETLANRDGSFGPDQVRAMVDSSNQQKKHAESGNVRVVGPAFLPDPEGAIDLKAPVRNAFP